MEYQRLEEADAFAIDYGIELEDYRQLLTTKSYLGQEKFLLKKEDLLLKLREKIFDLQEEEKKAIGAV